ncbi:uncharacterized protein LY89DRAFT_689707 [Mollisia scopiformis]|uniref:Uncharacterized protein n=1 Tax=Mollisia scopiformis TaxID=149040 RepID=A0A132BDH1_MOLSC|nr:uncharacterized protein LY89DRAFT_689707 [Mollisia scopiformis]KUJ10475.1 hypothetical protein LY89DRAFT_689707 [Mollisia scopiformis]
MKSQPGCITLEEEDPATGDPKPDTRTSASIFSPPEQSYRRRRERRKSDVKPIDGKSELLGSIGHAIKDKLNNLDHELLSLLVGEHEDNPEFRKTLEKHSMKHKIYYIPDKIINMEDHTFIEREMPVSKNDISHERPNGLIAQRTYSNGRTNYKAHKLFLSERIVLDQPYVFAKLGDEIGGVGCPDLHCIFRLVNDWDSMERRADLSTFDQDEKITDVSSKRQLVYDIMESKIVAQNGLKPICGISISCSELFSEAPDIQASKTEPEDAYLTPPSKKRRFGRRRDSGYEHNSTERNFCIKLIGMGPKIENGDLRADLNLKFVLKD